MNSELLRETVTTTVQKVIRIEGVDPLPPSRGQVHGIEPTEVLVEWVDGNLEEPLVVRGYEPGTTYRCKATFWSDDEWPDWLRNVVDEYAPKEKA